MRSNVVKIVMLACATTMLVPLARADADSRYWFRINGGGGGGVPSSSTPAPTPPTPPTPTPPTPAPPGQTTASNPTWGFCGTSDALTGPSGDCDGDGTPNMTPNGEGTLVDADPDDGWTPEYEEPEAADYQPAASLSFVPRYKVVPGTTVVSNYSVYHDSPGQPLFADQGMKVQVCTVKADCESGAAPWAEVVSALPETAAYADYKYAIKDGDLVRLRYTFAEEDEGVSTVKSLQSWEASYEWTLSSALLHDADGDGLADDIDPQPSVSSQLIVNKAHWRVRFERLKCKECSDSPEYRYGSIGEVSMNFRDEQRTGPDRDADHPHEHDVRSSNQANQERLADGDFELSWDPGATSGYVGYALAEERYPVSYEIVPSWEWNYAYPISGTFYLEYSDDGDDWKTYEVRRDVDLGYGGYVKFDTAKRGQSTSNPW